MSDTTNATLPTRTLEVNGIHAPLVEAGPVDASEAVAFEHGNPGSHEDWLPLVERVGSFARATVVVPFLHEEVSP